MTNEAHTLALNAAHSYRNIDPEHLDEQDAWVSLIKAIDALATMFSPAAKVGTEDADAQATPINMVLHCPACGTQHIDASEEEEYEDLSGQLRMKCDWTNPPHRSHLCHACEHVWRPADVPTNGVSAVKTTGKKDSPIAPQPPEAMAPAAPESFYVRFAKEWITASEDERQRISEWMTGWYGEPAAPVAAVGEAVPLTVVQYNAIPELCAIRPSLYESIVRAIERAHGILPAASMGAK